MLSSSFSTQGPTPTSNSPLLPGLGGSTPAAQALNNSPSAGINWNALTVSPANSNSANAKSQTVTHPDGTTVKTSFDTPTSSSPGLQSGILPSLNTSQPAAQLGSSYLTAPGSAPQTNQFGQLTSLSPATPPLNQGILNLSATPQSSTTSGAPAQTNSAATAPAVPTASTASTVPTVNPNAAFQNTVSGLTGLAGAALPATNYSASQLAGPASSSPAAQGYTSQEAQYGAGNIPIGQNAQNIANNYNQQIAQQIATGGQGVGLLTSGALNPVALGRAGAIEAAQNANIQQLESQEQQALAANAQGLTAQQQAAAAAQGAGGLAYQGLGLQQQGLQEAAQLEQGEQGLGQQAYGTAAGLLQPQLGAYGQGYYTPYNLGGATGQYGTGPVAAANVSSINSLQQQNNLNGAALQAIQANTPGLSSLLSSGQINPSQLNVVNGAIQAVAAQTSNPYYQEFANYLNDFANRYAQILTPAGGNVTNLQTQIAQQLLNGSASASSLQAVLNNLNSQAQNVMQGINNQISSIGGQTGGTNSSGSTASDPFDPSNFNL